MILRHIIWAGIVLVILILPRIAFTQASVNCDLYIEFTNRTTLCFETLRLNSFDRLIGDGDKYTTDLVSSFKLKDGLYIVVNSGTTTGIFKEEFNGNRISTYAQTINYANTSFDPNTGAMHTNSGSVRNLYYKRTNGTLKKMDVSNLIFDLKDNPESMLYVKKANKLTAIQAGFYVAGGAALIAGLVQTVKSSEENPGSASLSPLVFVGAGFCFVPWILRDAKYRKLQEAIDVYNR